ncbi:MAG: NAD(P)-binding protein [Myxococcaceae bacterium]|nr:NAD(P)-binding protein [Myxococcaceae bacterium]
MDQVRTLIIGAGISGLSTAAFSSDRDLLVLEADAEIGGYCKTVKKEGFTWDYSGHFFHFKHPEVEQYLRARMPAQNIRTVTKHSFIRFGDTTVDFPFQKNIHQLPQQDFIECLYDLYFADAQAPARGETPKRPPGTEANFKEMLYARFGRGICEKFLIPYNEKLYATDLSTLDKDAMGRFFPHANLTEIVRNMREPDNASYNATFTYPEGGAIEYVKALATEVPAERIALGEPLIALDLENRRARTPKREIRYERLVSSAPLNRLLKLAQVDHDPAVFSWNKVLVFNLGFDRKGARGVHWTYYPDRALSFYRVGWYDNIFDTDRLSLYVELGFPKDAVLDIEALRQRVLGDLLTAQVITPEHRLLAWHAVVMDPAYVHITRQSLAEQKRLAALLADHGVYSIGRYGRWTYCSIEDNILEARSLLQTLDGTTRF